MWISRKKFNELKTAVDALNAELKRIAEKPQLLGIDREGMKLVFNIYDNGKIYKVEAVQVVTGGKAEEL